MYEISVENVNYLNITPIAKKWTVCIKMVYSQNDSQWYAIHTTSDTWLLYYNYVYYITGGPVWICTLLTVILCIQHNWESCMDLYITNSNTMHTT